MPLAFAGILEIRYRSEHELQIAVPPKVGEIRRSSPLLAVYIWRGAGREASWGKAS